MAAYPLDVAWLTPKPSQQAANVGDSSAVLVDASAGTWSQLTADHRIANSSSERQRLQERGHTVKKRLYGLNISRMLGDRWGAGEGGGGGAAGG